MPDPARGQAAGQVPAGIIRLKRPRVVTDDLLTSGDDTPQAAAPLDLPPGLTGLPNAQGHC